jgi:hypothetical protein
MSSIKIRSEYLQDNSGDSIAVSQEFSYENQIREVTLKNTSSGDLTLYSGSTYTGSVSLGPSPLPSALIVPGLASNDPAATLFIRNSGDQSNLILSLTSSDGPIYTYDANGATSMELVSLNFFKNSFNKKTKRNIDHLYNVDKNGKSLVNSYENPLLESKTSCGLLRTNPKLTGNVKITIDSNEQIWLNSIDALKELADSRFKRFPISSSSNYVSDIYKFFDNGQTPAEIVYALYQQASSYYSTQRSLDQQYDRFYAYGAQQLNDKFYDEDFTFFAPLFVSEILPEYFVIFRSNGPLNEFSYTENTEDWKSRVNTDILKKADIVRVYDLSENSHIGRYIRNLRNHPSLKASEMTVSFQRDGYTTFNGISYPEASFAQKGELLADYFATPNTVLNTEEYLTMGFQRNKLISPNILNLEFLFDDPDAPEYSINRYFGLYLSSNEIATFLLSDKALEQYSLKVDQTPLPRKNVDGNKLSSRSFVQTNPNGIKLYVNTTSLERINATSDVFTTIVEETAPGATAVYFSGQWEVNPYISLGDTIRFGKGGTSTISATASILSISQLDRRALVGLTGFTASDPLLTPDLLAGYWADFYTLEKQNEINLMTFDNDIVQSSLRLFYLQDKKGNFYNVNSTRRVFTKVEGIDYMTDVEISLNEKKVDVSNFTGVNEILTQTVAEPVAELGYSVMELEITDNFRDFDYIEISMGIQDSIEPVRWRIKAQTPMLSPGQVWPDQAIVTDVDNTKYYLSLFHPGNSNFLSQVAETVKNAFLVFPYRVFDVTSDGTKVYFKSKIQGSTSNSMKITLNLGKENCVKIYGFTAPLGVNSVNFMGGSDKKRDRVIISREVARGILDIEYFKAVGSYSKLREFEVFGNKIRYYANLQKPVKNEFDEVVDFTDKEDYAVIEMEKDTRFDLTQDSKVTSYSIHRSKFGIFTFFPLKDFDTDVWISEYAKNYDAELIEFFDNLGAKSFFVVSGATSSPTSPFYDVVFPEAMGLSGDFSFIGVFDDGKAPRDYSGRALLSFSGEESTIASLKFYRGPSASWGIDDDQVALRGSNAPDRLVVLPGNKILYFNEDYLSKFKGFFSLSSIITDEDLFSYAYLESQWDFNRFFFNRISSEYQRLQENFLTSQALKSKVVPYVSKWISPDGKDVRDNPYRFNYSRAFGTMNFSPSLDYPDADSSNHTHEWPYLANVPSYVDPLKYTPFTFSYMFEEPDLQYYDFYSTTKDWFSEYFVTGYPTELYAITEGDYQKVLAEASEKYSVFKYDPITQKTYTIFRGIRLEIGEQLSLDTRVLIGLEKYENYKFSSVIVPVSENDFIYEDPVETELIINEKFKFILNIIRVKISGYKNPEGDLSYVDLYTMENKRDKTTYVTSASKISPAGATFSYVKAVPSDIMFPSPINFASGILSLSAKTLTFNIFSGDRGSLKNYVVPLINTGSYSYPYGFTDFNSGKENSVVFENILSVTDRSIRLPINTVNSKSDYFLTDTSFSRVFANVSAPSKTSAFWSKFKFYYASGGDYYYKKSRDFVSFFEISRILQGTSTSGISKTVRSISSDGSVSLTTKLLFRVVTPEKFLREVELVPLPDENKPAELYSYDIIGVTLQENVNPQYLYRYQGDFVPKFKSVFLFGAREEERFSMLFNNDFKLANTFIVEGLQDNFYLKNQYFSKVADQEILRIAQNSAFKSVYPLVKEISIDFRDLFIWSSSWDNLYYRKYITVSTFDTLKGTEEMKEIKSFLGSKMMKLDKSFSLYEFTINGDSPELVYTENGLKVTVDIDASSKFLRYLLEDGRVKNEFEKIASSHPDIIDPSQVETLATDYVRKNILDLFEIDRVNFYLKETGDPGDPARPLIEYNQSAGVQTTLTEREYGQESYIFRKDVKTSLLSNLKIRIEFTTDSRFYTSLGFGVEISRI